MKLQTSFLTTHYIGTEVPYGGKSAEGNLFAASFVFLIYNFEIPKGIIV
jgi:hypothetical protein